MRKLLSILLAGGLLIGTAGMASAVEIKVSGYLEFGFGLYDTGFMHHDDAENFEAQQLFRAQVEMIASESLKGVAQFEIGQTFWGAGGGASWGGGGAAGGAGGAMGADGVSVAVKHLYLDWVVPDTDTQVRMGIQWFANPRKVHRGDYWDGSAIIDDDMAGILVSHSFTEDLGINAGWFRPWDASSGGFDNSTATTRYGDHDEIDLFFLAFPYEMKETFSVTPYGMYALIGDDEGLGGGSITANGWPNGFYGGEWISANGQLGANGEAWWAGLGFDVTYWDPFFFAVDLAYGSYSSDDATTDRAGWTVIAKTGYKLDNFTPTLFGWYGSGTDDFEKDGRDGMIPVLSPYFGLTNFGWSSGVANGREWNISDNPGGTWSIGAGLEDIKYIDNLTTDIRVMYFQGTNDMGDSGVLANNFKGSYAPWGMLDTGDKGVEINFDNVINLYDNLDMFVELGYIHLNLEHEIEDFNSDAWKSYVGFRYSF